MRELMLVLVLVTIGLAHISKGTVQWHSITYLPYVLIAVLALLEIFHLGGFPKTAAVLVPVVMTIRWLTSKATKK